ncbi:MAG TPA: hypothetical protein VED24_03645 [Candidatus Acidoferrum sp.]|nr:hypothetical protein [Candidatus Acidoferrum sp.]
MQSITNPSPGQDPVHDIAVGRQLRVTDRAIIQLASSVVRGDPIKSLVELITNSDDSYRRMGASKETSFGRLSVSLDKSKNTMTVLDFAEGMDAQTMDESVGTYGSETSGFANGCSVRGFYGRGLKEAILGLGSGSVQSIKQGHYHECALYENGFYVRKERRRASLLDYIDLGIPYAKSGTRITITISKIKRLPSFRWFSYTLSNHIALRDIMQSRQRRIVLSDGTKSEILSYRPPRGRLVLQKARISIPGYEASMDLTVYMCDRPLIQEGYTRDGGILVRSRNAIHEATLFRFDYNSCASRLFGEVRCDYIDELMSRGELVVGDKRDGLDPHHPFTKALRKAVECELEPIVEHETAALESEANLQGEDLKARLNVALYEANRLAFRIMRDSIRYQRSSDRNLLSSRKQGTKTDASSTSRERPYFPVVFKGIRLSSLQDPRLRVYFDRPTGIINIATKAPSVAMYFCNPHEKKELLTLVAELVSDIVFFELATIVSDNAGSDDVAQVFNSLKNRYAHLIHKSIQCETDASTIVQ